VKRRDGSAASWRFVISTIFLLLDFGARRGQLRGDDPNISKTFQVLGLRPANPQLIILSKVGRFIESGSLMC
jgi:hypothetical protein